MAALARWCFRHRGVVIGLWLAVLVALGGLTAAIGTGYADEFSLPGTDSTRALELLQKAKVTGVTIPEEAAEAFF